MSAAKPGGSAAGTARFDVAGTARADVDSAWRRFGGADNPEEFCQSWLELQCELIGGVSDAVVVLQKPGVETRAARDTAAFLAQPPRGSGRRGGSGGGMQ